MIEGFYSEKEKEDIEAAGIALGEAFASFIDDLLKILSSRIDELEKATLQ